MTIVQALKNLVTAFGGTSTAKTASEAIEDVATAVEASSGGGGSKVEFVSPDSETLALNKTWAEIFALVKGGTLVCMVHSDEESCSMYIVSEVVKYENQGSTVYRVSFDDLANQSGLDALAESADGYPIVND